MPILVVLLEPGNPIPLNTWYEMDGAPIQEEKWRQMALDLARNALHGKFTQVEIFLCVLYEQFSDLTNYKVIKDAVISARSFGWGSNIYVVVDNSKYFRQELIDHLATFLNWFDEIYKAGATDVIHTSLNSVDSSSDADRTAALSNLRSSASSS